MMIIIFQQNDNHNYKIDVETVSFFTILKIVTKFQNELIDLICLPFNKYKSG